MLVMWIRTCVVQWRQGVPVEERLWRGLGVLVQWYVGRLMLGCRAVWRHLGLWHSGSTQKQPKPEGGAECVQRPRRQG